MEKKIAGSGLRYPASTWNNMVDAANHYTRQKQLGESQSHRKLRWDPGMIIIRNDTGAYRRKGDWLAVGDALGPVGKPNSNNLMLGIPENLIFSGDAATSRDDIVCCLLEPIQDGEMGMGRVFGWCWGLVDIQTDRTYKYAEAKVTSNALFNLDSVPYPGPVRIITNQTSGSGQKMCVCEVTQQLSRLRFRVPGSGSLVLTTSDQTVTLPNTGTGYFDVNDNLGFGTNEIVIKRKGWHLVTISCKLVVGTTRNTGVDYEFRLQRDTGSGYSDVIVCQGNDCFVDAPLPAGQGAVTRRLERSEILELDNGNKLKMVAKKTNYNGGMTVTLTEPLVLLNR